MTALLLRTEDEAAALVWPDVPERVERNLTSPDTSLRRAAARDLANLGVGRGTPLVLRAMGDSDVDVRIAAAKSAIALRTNEAALAALSWLGEREPRLRTAACDVARALPSKSSVPTLARALGDADPQVRAACAEALGAQGSDEATAPLTGKLDDPTPAVRVQIARALARIGDPRAVVPLVGKVGDTVPEVRQAVVRALGDLGDPRASQALLLTLRDNVPEVKIEALASLGRLRAAEAATAIAPLTLERNPTTRQAALTALGQIARAEGAAGNDAVLALVRALGTMDDASGSLEKNAVREALVTAGSAVVGELTRTLERPVSPGVATSAAWILGELHARASAPAIVDALRRGTLPPAAALRALAGAGTADQVPVVLEFVEAPTPAIRDEAVRAATALLDPAHPDGRAVEPLAAALRSPRTSRQSRAAIATLLGRTGAARAKTELVGLVNAKDVELRLAAIDALGALASASPKDPAGVADTALLPLLRDTDPAVRLHAAVALAQSGGAPAKKALLAQLDGAEAFDRYAVYEAIGGVGARLPDEATPKRLFKELTVAAGPERDAVIEAAGRVPLASVVEGLGAIATKVENDPDDRRAAAQLLAAQRPSPRAHDLLVALTRDGDPRVRAEAVFSLAAFADPRDVETLRGLVKGDGEAVAINAAAALARIGAARGPSVKDALLGAACPLLSDPRAGVRANALVVARALGALCGDGSGERRLLESDPSELVRLAAARTIGQGAATDLRRAALDRCAAQERNAEVARQCRGASVAPTPHGAGPLTVFVVDDEPGGPPKPQAAFLLQYQDGVLRAGNADRRGAAFDPFPPPGSVVLRRPSSP